MFVLLQRYTFWSNSQLSGTPAAERDVVCITAKIHFLKQFTTLAPDKIYTDCCLYYCKDTLFEAIHNNMTMPMLPPLVVCITAKIHFLKQFTTKRKSTLLLRGCLYYCKDTLFEAIHNCPFWVYYWWFVVCITAKIHFLKQFTTNLSEAAAADKLFVLLQRYTFWSNSQH